MEDNELKSLWNAEVPDKRTAVDMVNMLEEKRHPVLKGIRTQIIIETLGWSAFLVCYFSAFDGATKPVYINVILIVSVLAPLVHNLYGYQLSKQVVDSSSILNSLRRHVLHTKIYALRSIITRLIFTSGLLLFFVYNIDFEMYKRYLLVAVILAMVFIQVFFLSRIWQSRIRKLKDVLAGFENG